MSSNVFNWPYMVGKIFLFNENENEGSFFNNSNSDSDNDNDSEDTKMKEVDARFNKFSFVIKDKDASICLTIAINARENHFEINCLISWLSK